MPASNLSSPDAARLDLLIAVLTFLIAIGKLLPWIALALAAWSLYLGIRDLQNQNWVWAAVNVALGLGGCSFIVGLLRKRRQLSQPTDETRPVIRGEALAA